MKKVVSSIDEVSKVELSKVAKENIYAFTNNGAIYKSHRVEENEWAFIRMSNSYQYGTGTFNSLESLIGNALTVYDVYEFDSLKELCEWMLG